MRRSKLKGKLVRELNRWEIRYTEEHQYSVWSPMAKEQMATDMSLEEAAEYCQTHLEWIVYPIDKLSEEYLSHCLELTDDLRIAIGRHMRRYQLKSGICAYYRDWEDFCSDWCKNLGFTRMQARKLLYGKAKYPGEFFILPDGKGIIRFAI